MYVLLARYFAFGKPEWNPPENARGVYLFQPWYFLDFVIEMVFIIDLRPPPINALRVQ